MGASFRNIGEIIELAGCDRLTISPQLMDELDNSTELLERRLKPSIVATNDRTTLTEGSFRWQMNQDAMATEKLSEGIRNFTLDQEKLEKQLAELF